jgi:hypothetical protein
MTYELEVIIGIHVIPYSTFVRRHTRNKIRIANFGCFKLEGDEEEGTAWETIVQRIIDDAEIDPEIIFCGINHIMIDGDRYENDSIFPYFDQDVEFLDHKNGKVSVKHALKRVFEDLQHFELAETEGVKIISRPGKSAFKVGSDGRFEI